MKYEDYKQLSEEERKAWNVYPKLHVYNVFNIDQTNMKEDSAAYLKSWLNSLKEDASFIKTVLLDVKRAAALVTFKVDEVQNNAKAADAA